MKHEIEKNTVQETLVIPLYSRKLCTELYPNPKRQGHRLRCSCLALYSDAWSIEMNVRRHPGQADREALH